MAMTDSVRRLLSHGVGGGVVLWSGVFGGGELNLCGWLVALTVVTRPIGVDMVVPHFRGVGLFELVV